MSDAAPPAEHMSVLGSPKNDLLPWLLTIGALIAAALLSAAVGSVDIPIRDVIRILLARLPWMHINPDWPETFSTILLDIRLPGMALTVLTGMALGASGAAYQGLFRNPLADPYILGVAAGAGLGAVMAISFGWSSTSLGLSIIPMVAFAGGLLAVGLVYALARVGRSTPTTTLILAGVAVNSFVVALTSLVMLLSSEELRRALVWLLGGFSMGGWPPVTASLPYLIVGITLLSFLGRPLNVLQFGDEQAQQLGLDVDRFKLVMVVAASLVAATAVAFAGIIGFVGLVVPHVIRLLWGPDHRRLIPLAAIGGGAFLLFADIIARTLIAPRTLPVGIVTAMVGAPFFLWLLRRARRELRVW
jgi:iron complex transport system permease protein